MFKQMMCIDIDIINDIFVKDKKKTIKASEDTI